MRNDCLHGFRLLSPEVKVLAYAHDVALFFPIGQVPFGLHSIRNNFVTLSVPALFSKKTYAFRHGFRMLCRMFWVIHQSREAFTSIGDSHQNYVNFNRKWSCVIAQLPDTSLNENNGPAMSIFGRVTTFIDFLVDKIYYVPQFLHCSRLNIQRMRNVHTRLV